MVRKCCVPGCNGNDGKPENKEKTFRLPNNEDEKEARWLHAIPRENIPDSKYTVVCERHWKEGYEVITVFGKSRPLDPPTEFTFLKSSLVPTPLPPPRTTVLKHSRRKEISNLTNYPPF